MALIPFGETGGGAATGNPFPIIKSKSGFNKTIESINRQSITGTNQKAVNTASNNNPWDKYTLNETVWPADLHSNAGNYGYNYVVFYINVNNDSKITRTSASDVFVADIPDRQRSGATSANLSQTDITTGAVAAGLLTGVTIKSALSRLSPTAGRGQSGGLVGGLVSGSTGAITGGVVAGAVALNSSTTTRKQKRLKKAIALHMPNTLQTKYSSTWGEVDLKNFMYGAIGGEILQSLNPFSDSKIADEFKKVPGLAGSAALSVPKIGAGLSATSGLAPNPRKEMLFNAVDFRQFTMTYQFYPKSASESKLIKNIIQEFKYHMHPEFKDGDAGKFLYVYPSEFDISFFHRDKENENVNKITSCVLTSMDVDYSPNSTFNTFDGGFPTQIEMVLKFKELATLTKETIELGY